MDEIEIRLPDHVVRYACMIGTERRLVGMQKPGRYGAIQDDGWRLDIIGACGEAAVAKHFNYFWDGNMGDFKAKDVGKLQVRANGRENGDLILHDYDSDQDIFILVIATHLPLVILAGWLPGIDGKVQDYWREAGKFTLGRPAFFVPQTALHSMRDLDPRYRAGRENP